MTDNKYLNWANEVLKTATTHQANTVMNLRSLGWSLDDAKDYLYEDEIEDSAPSRSMYILSKGKDTVFVNQAGGILKRIRDTDKVTTDF